MTSHQRSGKEVDTSEAVETAPPAIGRPIAGESRPLRNWWNPPKIGDLRESISLDFGFTCSFRDWIFILFRI